MIFGPRNCPRKSNRTSSDLYERCKSSTHPLFIYMAETNPLPQIGKGRAALVRLYRRPLLPKTLTIVTNCHTVSFARPAADRLQRQAREGEPWSDSTTFRPPCLAAVPPTISYTIPSLTTACSSAANQHERVSQPHIP